MKRDVSSQDNAGLSEVLSLVKSYSKKLKSSHQTSSIVPTSFGDANAVSIENQNEIPTLLKQLSENSKNTNQSHVKYVENAIAIVNSHKTFNMYALIDPLMTSSNVLLDILVGYDQAGFFCLNASLRYILRTKGESFLIDSILKSYRMKTNSFSIIFQVFLKQVILFLIDDNNSKTDKDFYNTIYVLVNKLTFNKESNLLKTSNHLNNIKFHINFTKLSILLGNQASSLKLCNVQDFIQSRLMLSLRLKCESKLSNPLFNKYIQFLSFEICLEILKTTIGRMSTSKQSFPNNTIYSALPNFLNTLIYYNIITNVDASTPVSMDDNANIQKLLDICNSCIQKAMDSDDSDGSQQLIINSIKIAQFIFKTYCKSLLNTENCPYTLWFRRQFIQSNSNVPAIVNNSKSMLYILNIMSKMLPTDEYWMTAVHKESFQSLPFALKKQKCRLDYDQVAQIKLKDLQFDVTFNQKCQNIPLPKGSNSIKGRMKVKEIIKTVLKTNTVPFKTLSKMRFMNKSFWKEEFIPCLLHLPSYLHYLGYCLDQPALTKKEKDALHAIVKSFNQHNPPWISNKIYNEYKRRKQQVEDHSQLNKQKSKATKSTKLNVPKGDNSFQQVIVLVESYQIGIDTDAVLSQALATLTKLFESNDEDLVLVSLCQAVVNKMASLLSGAASHEFITDLLKLVTLNEKCLDSFLDVVVKLVFFNEMDYDDYLLSHYHTVSAHIVISLHQQARRYRHHDILNYLLRHMFEVPSLGLIQLANTYSFVSKLVHTASSLYQLTLVFDSKPVVQGQLYIPKQLIDVLYWIESNVLFFTNQCCQTPTCNSIKTIRKLIEEHACKCDDILLLNNYQKTGLKLDSFLKYECQICDLTDNLFYHQEYLYSTTKLYYLSEPDLCCKIATTVLCSVNFKPKFAALLAKLNRELYGGKPQVPWLFHAASKALAATSEARTVEVLGRIIQLNDSCTGSFVLFHPQSLFCNKKVRQLVRCFEDCFHSLSYVIQAAFVQVISDVLSNKEMPFKDAILLEFLNEHRLIARQIATLSACDDNLKQFSLQSLNKAK